MVKLSVAVSVSVAVMLLSVDDKVEVSVVGMVVWPPLVSVRVLTSRAVWTSSPPVERPPGPRVSLLVSVDVSW